jgi:hypothetical protein
MLIPFFCCVFCETARVAGNAGKVARAKSGFSGLLEFDQPEGLQEGSRRSPRVKGAVTSG